MTDTNGLPEKTKSVNRSWGKEKRRWQVHSIVLFPKIVTCEKNQTTYFLFA